MTGSPSRECHRFRRFVGLAALSVGLARFSFTQPAPEVSSLELLPPDSIDSSIEYESEDGIYIKGTLMVPPHEVGTSLRYPLVVLLHPLVFDRDSMQELAFELIRHEIAVAAIDIRGNGASRQGREIKIYSFPVVPFTDLHKVVDDVARLLDHVKKLGPVRTEQVALAGAGEGALVAIEAGSRLPQVSAVAMIDPTDAAAGFDPARELGDFDQRPVLLVASAFTPSKERVRQLADYGSGPREIVESDGFQKTARLLTRGGIATIETAKWLTNQLKKAPQ